MQGRGGWLSVCRAVVFRVMLQCGQALGCSGSLGAMVRGDVSGHLEDFCS